MNPKKIVVLITYFLFILALPIRAQEITLTLTGVGITKADAIIDAQRNALRVSYGEFISTNLTTLNQELTKNETVNLVSGTIQKSKLLSESVNDFSVPPITEVLMLITINKGKLVSFAEAIGDSVEIQGSLFGAELQQQEINKKNEAIAMEHLEKKAEIMPALFDYSISVERPKKIGDEYDFLGRLSKKSNGDFVIFGSLELRTNQNYVNLMQVVEDTVRQISMSPNEIEKYIEMNIPYYPLNLYTLDDTDCLDTHDSCKKQYWYSHMIEGRENDVKNIEEILSKGPKYSLRSNESINSIKRISDSVYRGIISYEIYRKAGIDRTIILPMRFSSMGNGDNNWTRKYMETITHLYLEMIRRNQPEADKEKMSDRCSKKLKLDFCYEDSNFTDYALQIISKYGYPSGEKRSGLIPLIKATHIKDNGKYGIPINNGMSYKKASGAPRNSAVYSARERMRSDRRSSVADTLSYTTLIGNSNFIIYPKDILFADIAFEDVVKRDEIASISAYEVDPDKATKRIKQKKVEKSPKANSWIDSIMKILD